MLTHSKRINSLFLSVPILITLLFSSCKKDIPKTGSKDEPAANQKTMSGTGILTIDIEDILSAMPVTIMYNVGKDGKAKLDFDHAQWSYKAQGVIVRIPTPGSTTTFIYATKIYAEPEKTNVYAVAFTPDPSSTDGKFSGMQQWIDFQDWKAYGVRYNKDVPVSYMEPVILAEADWEPRAMAYGHFYVDQNGVMQVIDDCHVAHPDNADNPMLKAKGGDQKCPGNPTGDGKSWVGRLFSNIGGAVRGLGTLIGGLFDGDGYGDGNGGSSSGGSFGSSWGGDFGNSYPNGMPGGWWPGYANEWPGGDGPGSPNPGQNPPEQVNPLVFNGKTIGAGNGIGVLTVFNSDASFVMSTLGLSFGQGGTWLSSHPARTVEVRDFLLSIIPNLTPAQKQEAARKHIQMMMTNPGYLDFVDNYTINYPTDPPILSLVDKNFVPQSATKPIYNTYDYFRCFSNVPGATYKVTIAVQQPKPNTRKSFVPFQNGVCDVGHTFLILEQNLNGVKTVRSIGWYPAMVCSPFYPNVPGVINNDENHLYHVALVNNVSGSDLMAIINEIKTDTHTKYDLNTYNCSNWAYRMIFGHPVDNISVTIGYWPFGYGMNPGDLGEDIRVENLESYQSRITTTGNAPMNQGTCP